jgi:hypothetical protein
MRKARFAKSGRKAGAERRGFPSGALWFGLRTPETSDEASLSDWRVTGLDLVPVLLGVTHALLTGAFLFLFQSRGTGLSTDNPLIPAGLALLCDAAAAVVLFNRKRSTSRRTWWSGDFAPTSSSSGCCGPGSELRSRRHLRLSPRGRSDRDERGDAMGAIGSVQSPPLIITNMITSAFAAVVLSDSPLVPFAVEVLSLALVAYSIAGSRSFISAGRKRLNLDAEAHKALNFVDEFENSGRGWFWETNGEGTLSYVLAAAGRRLPVPGTRAARAPVHRPAFGRHVAGREGRRAQDPRLPPVGALPLLGRDRRAASDEDIHWSLSGNPIFDERGRFLGFRGIGTDLTEQRRSEQEITRLARFDSSPACPTGR